MKNLPDAPEKLLALFAFATTPFAHAETSCCTAIEQILLNDITKGVARPQDVPGYNHSIT